MYDMAGLIIPFFKAVVIAIYQYLNQLTRGLLGILADTGRNCLDLQVFNGAAAIAYYALFSLLPLTLFLIAVASSVLENYQVRYQVIEYTEYFFPNSRRLIRENIEQLLQVRSTLGFVGSIGLLWSATSVFAVLVQMINQAWHTAPQRNFLQERLIGLVMMASLGVLLLLSLMFTVMVSLFSLLDIPSKSYVALETLLQGPFLSILTSWLFLLVSFVLLYKWAPNTPVSWSEAGWGALAATIGWQITKSIFTWYLTVGFSRYQLIYGSLGAVVAFMLWMYLSSLIILVGANLSAAISRYNKQWVDSPSGREQFYNFAAKFSTSRMTTGFRNNQPAKLMLAALTVVMVVAENGSKKEGVSLLCFLTILKELLLAPLNIKQAFDNFEEPALMQAFMGQSVDQSGANVDIEAYLAIPWAQRLNEVAEMLDSQLSPPQADYFKQFLLDIGHQVAQKSRLGFCDSRPRQNDTILTDIATALRANHLLA